jgi:O-antigen/teichoic acid export membrane protein
MVTIQSFFMIPNMTFAGKTEQAKQDVPQIIRTIVLQIARVVVVLLGYRALTLAFCNLVSVILIIPVIWYLFKDYPRGGYDKQLAKEYIKIALPMIIYGISMSLMHTLDKVLLQFFTNSEQVGYYSAGYRIGGFILIIANSVGMLFFPLFSKAISKGDYNFVKQKIEKFERFSLLFIMPAVIFFTIYADSIVKFVLGNEYIPSISVLSIITVAMFILVMNTPYGNIITGLGLFKLTAKIHIVNLVLFISTLVILTHPNLFGLKATGAALAVMVSNIFLGAAFRLYAKQKLNILRIAKNFNFVVFGVINFLIFFVLYNHFKALWGIPFRAVFPIIYFVLTYLAFILLKWINKNDWKMLLSIVDVKAMKKYVGSEIKPKRKIK